MARGSGNVWEFCTDTRNDYYAEDLIDPLGPENPAIDEHMNSRGGSWTCTLQNLRTARRYGSSMKREDGSRSCEIGIRCILINR